jgi:HipA-like protein
MISKLFKKTKKSSETTIKDDIQLNFGKVVFELKYKDCLIGQLEYENNQWYFSYSDQFKNQSELAPIVSFPDVSKKYEGKELWSFFLSRIPDNVTTSSESVKKHNQDLINQLKEYGRKTITNPFDLSVA